MVSRYEESEREGRGGGGRGEERGREGERGGKREGNEARMMSPMG